MKKSGWMITLLMFCCLLTVGCHKEESYDMQIYYLNSEETALNTEGYNLNSAKAEEQVEAESKGFGRMCACNSDRPGDHRCSSGRRKAGSVFQ